MRILLLVALMMSFSAVAQANVRENIKQKSVATSEDGSSSGTKAVKPKKGPRTKR